MRLLSLLAARTLHMRTERYAAAKTCNGLAGEVPLAAMPQLRAVFDDGYARLDAMLPLPHWERACRLSRFQRACCEKYCAHLTLKFRKAKRHGRESCGQK